MDVIDCCLHGFGGEQVAVEARPLLPQAEDLPAGAVANHQPREQSAVPLGERWPSGGE
jgi:hypothetical protein